MKRKNMYRNVGGKKIHVNQLAANSRKFSVNNNTIPKLGLNGKNIITNWKEIRTSRFDTSVCGKMFEIDKDGHYHIIEKEYNPTPLLFEHKQPKRLHKKYKKKYYIKGTHTIRKIIQCPSDYTTYTKALKIGDKVYVEGVFVNHTLPKMNKTQYMEKLVEHKTAKWERKNPCPAEMFTEDVEKWKQLRETAKERFRDFVVSIYDPLIVMGNRVNVKKQKIDASKIAEVKDVDGKGHDVSFPNLSTEDKLYKNAESAAKNVMKKDASIIDADLMNHKRNQKRPLLGAKRVTLADKKLKKAA